MKTLAAVVLIGTITASTFAQQSPGRFLPPVDRTKLPPVARNLPLERLSSGALTLLNRDNNLVAPPHSGASAKSGSIAEEQLNAPVSLDLRVGPNIRLGNDPPQLPSNMRAQAEPHIARAPTNEDFLAATSQEGRFAANGGAVDCGYSVSHDGGLTWTRALIPNLTQVSGGPYFRATDPVVAFDRNNNVYISTDAATDSIFANGVITVSKSTNGGSSFVAPVVAYQPPDNTVFPDKEWIAVNTFASTSTVGRIVVTFTLFNNSNGKISPIVRTYSDNGGLTWSPIGFVTGSTAPTQGSQPVFLPNGNLVVVYWYFGSQSNPGERLEARISTNGGVSFGSAKLISFATEWNEPSIRTGGFLPAATVDPVTGAIFVVYQTILNGSPRIAFTKSTTGGTTWSAPIAISNNPFGSGVFNPAISVSPGGHTLSAVFYDHRANPGSNTLVDLYLAQSFDGGVTWQPNIRLTSVSTDASLAPLTSDGYMLGDYLGVAQSTRATVPAVPVWVDTRTGNPDPFITRAGLAPYVDSVAAWEAAHLSLAQVPASSLRLESSDLDRDQEDTQSEVASGTDSNNPASVVRTGQELNISSRLRVETDERVAIAGFIITGSQSKNVIIRALGPSLAQYNVSDVLQNPTLSLYDHDNRLIAFNDNWTDSQQSTVQATGLAPGDVREAAIIRTLAPGSYTAIVRGLNNTAGIALVEVYDLNQNGASILTNLSTRGLVGTGNNVLIGGFIIGSGLGVNGDGSSKVLIRAIGPELTASGVPGALQDPTLALHDGNGNLINSNDNWKSSQQAAIQATGLAPTDDREPAILTTLVQGNWTAIVRGKNDTTGVGLIEVYRIQ